MIVRIIDIGSNSVKSSRYSIEPGRHRLADRDKLDYSLGNAVFPDGPIPDAGMERIAAFIASEPKGAEKARFTFALATSAVRSAPNRDAFVRRIEEKTGVSVRVLSGAEESYLIHLGIISRAGVEPGQVIKTIDIGGGSAEVSWSRGGRYLFGHSYELGAIRLTRRFLDGKALTREAFAQIHEHAMGEFRKRTAAAPPADRAIGSSGNVRALTRMLDAVRAPGFARAVPFLTPGTLEDVAEAAFDRTPAQISAFFGINLERARIVMPAAAVLLAGMRHFDIRRLETTEAGLREGAMAFWSKHGHFDLPLAEDAPHEGPGKNRR
jgi:exopolyphosphatase/guanosine-5'-triphosphate,3'-diphosphate pyrophosphatase